MIDNVYVQHNCPAVLHIHRDDGTCLRLVSLTQKQSITMWQAEFRGKRRVFLTEATLVANELGLYFTREGKEQIEFRMFPGEPSPIIGTIGEITSQQDGIFTYYSLQLPTKHIPLDVSWIRDHKAVLKFDKEILDQVDDVLLSIDYEGDVGNMFVDGLLLHDHFFNGLPWEIGLKRFFAGRDTLQMDVLVTPKRSGKVIFSDSAMAIQHSFI
ncbi:MAG: hypothetical protein WDZ91_03410 [Paenibacillaceae bacterium]